MKRQISNFSEKISPAEEADHLKVTAYRSFTSIKSAFESIKNWIEENDRFKNIEEFEIFLAKRHQPEKTYGHFFEAEPTACRFFEDKNGENILSDIFQINEEQGMGNIQIPNTKIKLINYSKCPKCGHIFSYKDLADYYVNPKPDSAFKTRQNQFREDTRVFCFECDTYFLPSIVIFDEAPINEVQFLCRIQTMDAIEKFYRGMGIRVLSARKELIKKQTIAKGLSVTGIKNDVLLKELIPKPTLIYNLIQYTPANLILNLVEGTNFEKGDLLFVGNGGRG